MIVLDTSAAVELILNLPLGRAVRERITDPDVTVHAPQLLILEVLQILRRRVAASVTTAPEAETAVDLLDQLDVHLYDHRLLGRRVWELRENLTAYDAAYVALAEILDVPLVTTDARLARAPGNRARADLLC